ncbi:MAG: ATP-binding protein [Deltaproteobacteria bacterium]|jgi:two-component system sensor histidine kinase PilS (NtrC family)|nr:ATP-binding protein [Deltaproteobacteria bacterium]MDH3849922.1 ATP-binding protein [Deltaproteobacteria bacterium]MDH3896571.1 ATP-binding protein [Deltaproteobacteria bacterium]MDH3950078.1 ATP-binding protein [Deltaproteobacteria bacterium]MDH3962351.1 ATP-binding protein [Deltaproteobacteria bacterium]
MSELEQDSTERNEELLGKIKWLMVLRLLFATFLLVATVVVQARAYPSFSNTSLASLYILTGVIYFLTLCYALLLDRIKKYIFFAYVQLVFDVLFVTALIYVTGGIESIFSFMYILTIINAAIMLYRRGGLLIASASSIGYGSLLDLQYFGIIHPYYIRASELMTYTIGYYFYTLLMNIAAFYLVAFLSSYLAEELRRSGVKLKAKQYDLDQLELLNRNIVQSINTGLITLNNQLEISYINPAVEQISGFGYRDLEGIHIGDIFPKIVPYLSISDRGGDNDDMPQPQKGIDVDFDRRDGTRLHLGFSQSILKDPGGDEIGLILIFQDLTEFRQMQEQVRRMDRLAVAGELAAGIAHEIKNPLASLSGSIQMLRDEVDFGPMQQRLMDITMREAERLNALVNEFLLFARPERAVDRSVEVNEVIEDTLEMLKNSPELSRPIRIEKTLSKNLWVHIDSQRLQQVIWNLVLNAVQEMKNSGRLSVATAIRTKRGSGDAPRDYARDRQEKLAEISISDTGPGILPENQGKVFDPFFTTKDQGTGLGLTIVHRIVENYDGKIFLDSDGRSGTTFTLHFPLAEEDPQDRPQ